MATRETTREYRQEIEGQAKGKVCAKCEGSLTIAWRGGKHTIFCPTCQLENPPLRAEGFYPAIKQGEERMELAAKGKLTIEEIKRFICPTATDSEAYVFLRFCQAEGLNPFLKDAYLVKYQSQPAYIVIGIDTHVKRATRNPKFGGYQSGIVVKRGDSILEIAGTLMYPDDILLGGWCEVYVAGWANGSYKRAVSLVEYNRNQALWRAMPATMIEKVAVAQTLRRAVPEVEAMYQELKQQNITVVPEGAEVVESMAKEIESPASEPIAPIQNETLAAPPNLRDLFIQAGEEAQWTSVGLAAWLNSHFNQDKVLFNDLTLEQQAEAVTAFRAEREREAKG